MRKTLSLPIKTHFNAAQYAKTMQLHPPIPAPAAPPARSTLFDEPALPQQRARTARSGHQVAAGTLSPGYPLRTASGTLNRPDKSEQRTNLTFNWSPA